MLQFWFLWLFIAIVVVIAFVRKGTTFPGRIYCVLWRPVREA